MASENSMWVSLIHRGRTLARLLSPFRVPWDCLDQERFPLLCSLDAVETFFNPRQMVPVAEEGLKLAPLVAEVDADAINGIIDLCREGRFHSHIFLYFSSILVVDSNFSPRAESMRGMVQYSQPLKGDRLGQGPNWFN